MTETTGSDQRLARNEEIAAARAWVAARTEDRTPDPALEVERARMYEEALALLVFAHSLPGPHIIDLRRDGWTINHPWSCRPNLFDCPVDRAAVTDFTAPPPERGQFECHLHDGQFVIGSRVPG